MSARECKSALALMQPAEKRRTGSEFGRDGQRGRFRSPYAGGLYLGQIVIGLCHHDPINSPFA